jgi:transposase InsO family protein
MNIHRRAKTCPESRALLCRRVLGEEAWPMGQASRAAGVSRQTVRKWVKRFLNEGEAGLTDRSSRPHRSPRKLPASREDLAVHLRRQHRLTAQALAELTGIPRSTLGRVLRRHRLSRARDLEPKPPVIRYERQAPGELIHLDIKKLSRIQGVGHRITGQRQHRNRGIGWEYAHVAIDDFSRLSYMEVLPDERADTVAGFLRRALAWYRQHGIVARRLLTDNGNGYVSHLFAQLCQQEGLRHLRTRPYTPRTNGKAERFIQTSLRSWAYGRPYTSSQQRLDALPRWLHYYNHHRPHASLGRLPPVSRVNNLVSTDN